MNRLAAGLALTGTLLLAATTAGAQQTAAADAPRQVYIAIVIDDIGYLRENGLRALELPGDLSFAVIPHTPHGAGIARLARELGKDVLVHLPMESVEGHRLGPGGIDSGMQREELEETVSRALVAVPGSVGLSNHMGSRLTADRDRMTWLMQVLGRQSAPFFLDSRTSEHTVAAEVASQTGIPYRSRDVFLDNVLDRKFIERQFFRLISEARANGSAVGIGHPHDETIAVLAALLPRLENLGVKLVPVTRLHAPSRADVGAPSTLQARAQVRRRTP